MRNVYFKSPSVTQKRRLLSSQSIGGNRSRGLYIPLLKISSLSFSTAEVCYCSSTRIIKIINVFSLSVGRRVFTLIGVTKGVVIAVRALNALKVLIRLQVCKSELQICWHDRCIVWSIAPFQCIREFGTSVQKGGWSDGLWKKIARQILQSCILWTGNLRWDMNNWRILPLIDES